MGEGFVPFTGAHLGSVPHVDPFKAWRTCQALGLSHSPQGETWNDTFGDLTSDPNHGKLKTCHGNLSSIWNVLLMEELLLE